MRIPALALIFSLLPAVTLAEAPMTAAEFEAATTGRTLTYAEGGQVYGVEQYKPGRRVLWAFRGDQCREGIWYEDAGDICFIYEHDPTPQCWQFHKRPGGMTARFMGRDAGTDLSVVAETSDPLLCAGPDVGV